MKMKMKDLCNKLALKDLCNKLLKSFNKFFKGLKTFKFTRQHCFLGILLLIGLLLGGAFRKWGLTVEGFDNPSVELNDLVKSITFHQGTAKYMAFSQIAVYGNGVLQNAAPSGTVTARNTYKYDEATETSNISPRAAVDGNLRSRGFWKPANPLGTTDSGGYESADTNPDNFWKIEWDGGGGAGYHGFNLDLIQYYNFVYEDKIPDTFGTFFTLENEAGEVIWTSPPITSSGEKDNLGNRVLSYPFTFKPDDTPVVRKPVMLDEKIRYIILTNQVKGYVYMSQLAVYTADDPNTNIAVKGTVTSDTTPDSISGPINAPIDGVLEIRENKLAFAGKGYWKLDLGAAYPISKMVCYGVTNYVSLMEGYVFEFQDADGKTVWKSDPLTYKDAWGTGIQTWTFTSDEPGPGPGPAPPAPAPAPPAPTPPAPAPAPANKLGPGSFGPANKLGPASLGPASLGPVPASLGPANKPAKLGPANKPASLGPVPANKLGPGSLGPAALGPAALGPAGLVGPRGLQGPPGQAGARGPPGQAGARGPPGRDGQDGLLNIRLLGFIPATYPLMQGQQEQQQEQEQQQTRKKKYKIVPHNQDELVEEDCEEDEEDY